MYIEIGCLVHPQGSNDNFFVSDFFPFSPNLVANCTLSNPITRIAVDVTATAPSLGSPGGAGY